MTPTPLSIKYLEPNPLLRRLRVHDLSGLRCYRHSKSPKVLTLSQGLVVTVCCESLAEPVRRLLGTS